VIWGAVVMAATGLLLWANNLAMRSCPRRGLDVATSVHFYEAVLATLAIVVWHFYGVIFDPDIYPLNTAFLTGRTPKQEEPAREHPVGGPVRGTKNAVGLTQNMTPNNSDRRSRGWLSPVVHLCNN